MSAGRWGCRSEPHQSVAFEACLVERGVDRFGPRRMMWV
ncbi:hypothetical protein SAMN05216506_104331 [Saccharopolyspora kobensis]|uniref:Transposase n=1 Tax=Saccharopolyspora kobensis TaxID=146035 RepID=A0ABY1DXC7_9PSEU|nr:hypothetical protein SAMN05216506_104331 [Saccharopolyspora kobensis]